MLLSCRFFLVQQHQKCEKWVNQNGSTHLLQVNGRGSVTIRAGSTKWPDRHRISPSGVGVGSCCDSGWQRPGSLRRDRDEEWGRSRRWSEICSSFLTRCANGVRQHWGRQSGTSSCAAQAGLLQSSVGREITPTLKTKTPAATAVCTYDVIRGGVFKNSLLRFESQDKSKHLEANFSGFLRVSCRPGAVAKPKTGRRMFEYRKNC